MHSRETGGTGLYPRGVRTRLEGKQRTPLSSRVATRVSWSPLSGLKGVQPPLPFGERTRVCSPGQAGKEGPHLAPVQVSLQFHRQITIFLTFSEARLLQLATARFQAPSQLTQTCLQSVGCLLPRESRGSMAKSVRGAVVEEPPDSVTDRLLLCQENPSFLCAHFSLRVWGYQTGGAQCSMGEKQHQPNPSLSLCSRWSLERWPASWCGVPWGR